MQNFKTAIALHGCSQEFKVLYKRFGKKGTVSGLSFHLKYALKDKILNFVPQLPAPIGVMAYHIRMVRHLSFGSNFFGKRLGWQKGVLVTASKSFTKSTNGDSTRGVKILPSRITHRSLLKLRFLWDCSLDSLETWVSKRNRWWWL